MFQDSPIYDRLVAECGDVPTQARQEAERVSRELGLALRLQQSPGHPPGPERPASPGNGWQRSGALPGPRQH